MKILQMGIATLLPVLACGLLMLLTKKVERFRQDIGKRNMLAGIVFGMLAILATEFGIPAGDGVVMNVRDAAPLCAGLFFGSPAGLVSGCIGGLHRWLCMHQANEITRMACALSTFLAGLFGDMMRRQMFENRNPGVLSCIGIGSTMEVLHMLLLLATNLTKVSHAFSFVQASALPMCICSGISVGLASLVCSLPIKPDRLEFKSKKISHVFGFWLLVCVIVAFLTTSAFTQQVVYRITTNDAELYRKVTLYLVAFIEILIYTALFILIYQMLKKRIVRNLQKVNEGLNAITNGNLNTVIDVRDFQEFSELSDDVNATVSSLKHYIKEAEERIDQELEIARQIQHSALPSVFPPYPDRQEFELFASMDSAKEVGGDFYDFYFVGEDQLAFMIADVSGKGIPAAMFMMTAKTTIKDLAESGLPIDEVMNRTNERLCASNEAGMFVTAWMGILNLKTGLVRFVNAGHNPPLVCCGDGDYTYFKTRPNLVLAGMEGIRYRAGEKQLSPGDTIVLYTDGVTEATNGKGKLYGEERLNRVLNTYKILPIEELCERIRADVDIFVDEAPQFDDITLLALKYKGSGMKKMTVEAAVDNLERVTAFVDDLLEEHGCTPRARTQIDVAIDEIFCNIASYAYAPEKGSVTVAADVQNGAAVIEFTDEGMPFNPLAADDPDLTLDAEEREVGGLGIYLVKKTMDDLQYTRENGKNILKITKRIQ